MSEEEEEEEEDEDGGRQQLEEEMAVVVKNIKQCQQCIVQLEANKVVWCGVVKCGIVW